MLLSMQGSSLSQGSIVCVHGGGGRRLSKYLQNFLFQIICFKLKTFSLISFFVLLIMPK